MSFRLKAASLVAVVISAVATFVATDPSFASGTADSAATIAIRSEGHTSELQSLMRISYAVVCLKKKIQIKTYHISRIHTCSTSTMYATLYNHQQYYTHI